MAISKNKQGVPHIYLQEHTIAAATNDSMPVLDLSACGVVKNSSGETSFETAEYALIYVNKGTRELSLSNKTITLSAGDVIVCRPHEQKKILAAEEETGEFYWFSFRGRVATEILSLLKLTSKDKYFVGHDNELTAYMDKTVDEWNRNETASAVFVAAFTMVILCQLSRLAVRTAAQDQAKGHDKIAPAISSINSDCTSKLSVDDYAKMCNLSTSYFTHLFTAVTGFSPMEYKQLQRINIAKNLLSTTNLSIKEISTVVGFKDPLYFGRCFKQATGKTPSGYRASK